MTINEWKKEIKQQLGIKSLKGYASTTELDEWYNNLLDVEHVAQMLRDRKANF